MAADPAVPSLADVLAEHCFTEHYMTCECRVTTDWSHETMGIGEWAEHVEAEYWAARRVTTVEQLDALPAEAVVRTTQISGITQSHTWTRRGCARGWQSNGDPVRSETVVQIASRDGLGIDWEPIRVLWLPGEGEQ